MGKISLDVANALAEPKRLRAINEANIIDTPNEALFDNITANICRDLNVPLSLISIVDKDRQFFKSEQGLPCEIQQTRQTTLRHSLCIYVVRYGHILSIENLREDPGFEHHPIIEDFGVLSYLGVPLIYKSEVIGSVCALDSRPRKWGSREIEILQEASASIQAELYFRNL